jgi:hypothetical protein
MMSLGCIAINALVSTVGLATSRRRTARKRRCGLVWASALLRIIRRYPTLATRLALVP